MRADQRIVDRVGRRVLDERGPIEEQERQQGADGGVVDALAGGHDALVAELRGGQAGRFCDQATRQRDALTILLCHQTAQHGVLPGGLKNIGLRRFDNLLGVLGAEVSDDASFVRLPGLPDFPLSVDGAAYELRTQLAHFVLTNPCTDIWAAVGGQRRGIVPTQVRTGTRTPFRGGCVRLAFFAEMHAPTSRISVGRIR